jgi:ABC-type phosphonate transport system ATPase subunit
MSQNVRLAMWLPTTDDADPGEVVEVVGASGSGKVIPTRFHATATLSDAPADSVQYGRYNNTWTPVATLPAVFDGGTF